MNFIRSITFRFTLWYLVVLSILLILLAGGVYFTLSQTLYRNFDHKLGKRAEHLSGFRNVISIVASGTFEEELGEVVSFYYYEQDQLQQTTQPRHKVNTDLLVSLIDNAFAGGSSFTTIFTEQSTGLRVFITPFSPVNRNIRLNSTKQNKPDFSPLQIGNDRRAPKPLQIHKAENQKAVLVIARPISDIETALDRLFHILCLAVPLTIVLAGGGGVFLARRVLRPVEEITETAKKIEESDLSRRIDVSSRDELGRLATTLNQMITRLENAFIRQKEFTSDASHELRAPLAVIQAESTLALQKPRKTEEYQKSLEVIADESDHLAGIINQLLNLARVDAGKELKFEKINLTNFVMDLCDDVSVVCQSKSLTLQQNHFDEAWVMGDRRSLRNLFHNILENAMRYTPERGTITVTLRHVDGQVVVSIKDTGIGISADEQSLIFQRFYRVDKARSRNEGGSGLGLSICRHIVNVHGGSIKVESMLNKGSTFRITLPEVLPITPLSKSNT